MTGRDADLKAALRQLPAPEPSAELLPRILHSRATGARVTTPTRQLLIPWRGLAAAAIAAVLIGGSWMVSLSLSRLGSSPAVREPIDEFLRGTGILPSRAPLLPDEVLQPKYGLITSDNLDVTRLQDGVWTYAVEHTTDDVLTQQMGALGIRVAHANLVGRPVWMVNLAQKRHGDPWNWTADTTQLDPTTLRPQRGVYTNTWHRRLLQTFSSDSGREVLDITGSVGKSWRTAVALPFPSNALFINDWSAMRLAVLLPALRLERGWRGTIYQVAFITQGGERSIAPIDVRVRGTDRVNVPAGSFDCWRVDVETHLWNRGRETWWVSRDNAWLIKREARAADDVVVSTLLQSYEPSR